MNSSDQTNKVLTTLAQICNQKIAIFGAGETGQEFVKLVRREQLAVEIVNFIDSNRTGETLGITVISPDKLHSLTNDVIIIIGSVFWNEIASVIKTHCQNRYLILSNELINTASHLSAYGSFYFDDKATASLEVRYSKIIENFETVLDKEIFRKAFELRVYKKEDEFFVWAADHIENQKKLFSTKNKYSANLNLEQVQFAIEGGVFDGEDTSQFIKKLSQHPNFKKLYAIDPDLRTLKNGSYYSALSQEDRCHFEQFALYSDDVELLLLFDRENPANTKVIKQTEATNEEKNRGYLCQGITLDTFIKCNNISKIDLLKLDTEGAEMDILQGGRNTILENFPQIAISLYHKKEHLLEIPEYLLSLNPQYRFTMSLNNASFIDMVMYAINK
jgi:FkbM family methyltransferase